MSIFKQLCRTLVLSAVVVALSVGLMGCPDTPPDDEVGGYDYSLSCGNHPCRTVVMPDGKTWMAENLNYEIEISWCYNDSPDSCAKYGRLYPWAEAKAVCPKGWHLPSRDEWGGLAKSAGGTGDYGANDTAGKKLKSTSGWNSDGNGTDDFGFSALPGGFGGGARGGFVNVGEFGSWWMDTEQNSGNAYHRHMSYRDESVYEGVWSKGDALSVRCIKN